MLNDQSCLDAVRINNLSMEGRFFMPVYLRISSAVSTHLEKVCRVRDPKHEATVLLALSSLFILDMSMGVIHSPGWMHSRGY